MGIKIKIKQIYILAKNYSCKLALFEFLSSALGYKRGIGRYFFDQKHEVVKKILRDRYSDIIETYKGETVNQQESAIPQKVWIFWWQGDEKMPEVVKLCTKSVLNHMEECETVIISKNNIEEYVSIPKALIDKVEEKVFSVTTFSDYVRFAILSKHGGIWLDSTIFLSNNIYNNCYGLQFYSIKYPKGELDSHVCKGKWNVSVLGSTSENKIMRFCHEMMERYMLDEKYLMTYLLIDCVISIGYEDLEQCKIMIDEVKCNNGKPGKLGGIMNEIFDGSINELFSYQSIHKLSYKVNYQKRINNQITNYGFIVENE